TASTPASGPRSAPAPSCCSQDIAGPSASRRRGTSARLPTSLIRGGGPLYRTDGVRFRGRLTGMLPFVLLVLAAAWWIFGLIARPTGIPSADFYASSYPTLVYELRSLRAGHGFFWTRFQNCGQPFPPATAASAFYPLYLVFLAFDVDRGLLVIAFLHLALGAVGTYLLCREIGLGGPASLCGALSFQLSGHLRLLALWHPIPILGSLVWLPWAL